MVKQAAFVLVSALVLAGLWLYFKPQAAERTAPAQPPKAFELVVEGGKLVSGPALIRVRAGEAVSLEIRSDRKDEVHLHGYDLRASVAPGAPAKWQFTAARSGRFGIELHKAHAELGALEVYPQ